MGGMILSHQQAVEKNRDGRMLNFLQLIESLIAENAMLKIND